VVDSIFEEQICRPSYLRLISADRHIQIQHSDGMLHRYVFYSCRTLQKYGNYRVTNFWTSQIMPLQKRGLSDVQRLRLQQQLKQVDQFSEDQYRTGLYLIFIRKEGQVLISKQSRGFLSETNFEGMYLKN